MFVEPLNISLIFYLFNCHVPYKAKAGIVLSISRKQSGLAQGDIKALYLYTLFFSLIQEICAILVLMTFVWNSAADALPERITRSASDNSPWSVSQHSTQSREAGGLRLLHLWREQYFQELVGQLSEVWNRHGSRIQREQVKPSAAPAQDPSGAIDQAYSQPAGQVPPRYDEDIRFPSEMPDYEYPSNINQSTLPESKPTFNVSDCDDDWYCEHVDGYPA